MPGYGTAIVINITPATGQSTLYARTGTTTYIFHNIVSMTAINTDTMKIHNTAIMRAIRNANMIQGGPTRTDTMTRIGAMMMTTITKKNTGIKIMPIVMTMINMTATINMASTTNMTGGAAENMMTKAYSAAVKL